MTLWLFLHIAGCVLFLGNIITAAFWKVRADLKGDPAEIHNTVKNVMLADLAFTLPGLLLIIISGVVMAVQAGYAMGGMNWLMASLILFGVTGILWAGFLIPMQKGMIRHSMQSIRDGVISAGYKRASTYWAVGGTIATLLPIVILYFMVSKPF
ncbi:DUF2269 family protein [Paenibacillus sp. MDMC362]|uniref:DUF2269 family protein n=1 Tax=Paenibacillus sp. MDMC362 TaxID=2977365 RepID=UPI000DC24394|nr:DUF2269 family protein [Paenibacillus sp. MDMC362]RAR44246.1 hypothetical protein DP091_09495 [Paenibacillus sp. MDMC362]